MKVLTTLTVSGGLNLSSNAKDTFSIGTPLEHNDGLVDDLVVYANADFKNNVILGSSSVDTVTSNAKITASAGLFLNNCSLNITGGTVYVNGQDVLGGGGNGGGGGGGNGGGGGGGGSNIKYYIYTIVSSSTHVIDENNESEIYYSDTVAAGGNVTITLPNAGSDAIVNRKFYFKQISGSSSTLIYPSGSQTIDGSNSFIAISGIASQTDSLVVHAMKDTRDNSFKWFRLIYP